MTLFRLESPIDGTSFNNLTNMKIRHSYDYTSNSLTAKIHWVEVYFLPQDNDTVQRLSARELGQMTSSIAKACMSALSPHLMVLIGLNMLRIGLRVNLASDFVSEICIMIIFWEFFFFSKLMVFLTISEGINIS